MKWRVKIKLKFRRWPRFLGWKYRKVGFWFEWKAWLIAYELHETDPVGFTKLPIDDQMTALIYGGALWHCVKTGKRQFFDYPDMKEALNQASKLENSTICTAIGEAQFPDWMKKMVKEKAEDKDGKKKSKKKGT